MASRRKLPLVLFLITLVLLAGAVVLLLRGVPSRWSASRPGSYAITGQEEATVTLTLPGSRCRRPFPRRSPSAKLREQLKLPLLQDGDTTFYLTAFARSDEDPRHPLRRHSAGASALPGRGTASPSPSRIDEDGGITAQLRVSDLPVPGRTERTAPMRPGWPARAQVNSSPCM